MIRSALVGALATCIFVFPAAALLALVYKFPVPFGGYLSGLTAVPIVLLGVVYYGTLFGGFLVLGAAGAAAGVVAHSIRGASGRELKLTLGLSMLLALTATLTLAILDTLIGPW